MPIETNMYTMQPDVKLDPAGSMAKGISLSNAMLQNRLLQSQVPLQISNEQMANAAKQLQMVSDHLTPLIGMGDKVTADDVQRVALQAVRNSGGGISMDHAQQFVQQITSNPSGIPAALQQFHQRTLSGLAQAQAIAGQQSTVDTGPSVQHLRTNLYTGAVQNSPGSASAVQTYPTRQQMSQPGAVGFNPVTGAPIVGTDQQRINARGGSDLLAPGFRVQRPASPPPPSHGVGGNDTGARQMPTSGAPSDAPVSGQSSPYGSLTPGPIEAPMESATKGLQDDFANSSAKMSGTQPLLQAIPLVEALGPSGTGPSSEVENRLKSFLVTRGVIKPDATNVDVRNEASKYLKKYVTASGASAAGGSDYRTAFASESNPNLDTDQKATLSLARAAVAFDRMDAARPLAFGTNPDAKINDYGRHRATWTQSQDVRAYGLDLMEPKKRSALVGDMQRKAASKNEAERQEGLKFFRSLKVAHDNQMLTGTTNAGQ